MRCIGRPTGTWALIRPRSSPWFAAMQVLIVTPVVEGAVTGNLASAERYRGLLGDLGHEVELAHAYDGQTADLLVALHAVKGATAVAAFRAARPLAKVAVVLTGTDIYPEPGPTALETMAAADRLVALQHKAAEQVPAEWRDKVQVIVQSAENRSTGACPGGGDTFDVAVVANLREVKDPLRAAAAARLLPAESTIRIRHAGAVLEEKFAELAEREAEENPRYQWLGALRLEEALRLIADSDLLVLSSVSEGAGRVVGEAVVAGTPVLSSRIDGVVGLLGEDYPAYYPVGDTAALAGLLWRTETDGGFRAGIADACRAAAGQFAPEWEIEGWRELIAGLAKD